MEVFKKIIFLSFLIINSSCDYVTFSKITSFNNKKTRPKATYLMDYYSSYIRIFYQTIYVNVNETPERPFKEYGYAKYFRGTYDGELEPEKVPDLDRDMELKVPEDLNNNEVPDYYEVFINRGVENELLRKLYKEMGRRAYRTFKKYDSLSKAQKKKALEEIFKPLSCSTGLAYFDFINDIRFSGKGGVRQLEINHKEALFSPGWREGVFNDLIASFDKGDVFPIGRMTPREALEDCPDFVFIKHPKLKEILAK